MGCEITRYVEILTYRSSECMRSLGLRNAISMHALPMAMYSYIWPYMATYSMRVPLWTTYPLPITVIYYSATRHLVKISYDTKVEYLYWKIHYIYNRILWSILYNTEHTENACKIMKIYWKKRTVITVAISVSVLY